MPFRRLECTVYRNEVVLSLLSSIVRGMGRSLRMFEPNTVYFITSRTAYGRLFMTPTPAVNAAIGGILAHAIRRHDVKVYNFVFLSNHFHMLLSGKPAAIATFMKYLCGNIATKVSALLDLQGPFWSHRYSAQAVLDDDAVIDRMRYIFQHGVKEGLVDSHIAWPGIKALPQLLGDAAPAYAWPVLAKQNIKVVSPELLVPTPIVLTSYVVATPSVDHPDHTAQIRKLAGEAQQEARLSRDGSPWLGLAAILNQDPKAEPIKPNLKPRPLCHTTLSELYHGFRQTYRDFVAAYREATAALYRGDFSIPFPAYAFPPAMRFGGALSEPQLC